MAVGKDQGSRTHQTENEFQPVGGLGSAGLKSSLYLVACYTVGELWTPSIHLICEAGLVLTMVPALKQTPVRQEPRACSQLVQSVRRERGLCSSSLGDPSQHGGILWQTSRGSSGGGRMVLLAPLP